MFLVLCCDVCNNFCIKTITPLPPAVCRQAHVLYVLFDFVVNSDVMYDLYVSIGVTWRVSYKKQELLTLCEHLDSPPVIWWDPCCSSLWFSVLCDFYFAYPCLVCPSVLDCPSGFL